ncbi:hypothetical protein HY041_04175 [Candidatus Roizmanbacteria bacterium]|nr:hypothetical protein [Candidatus Roizmanbacteria bacterium]
MQNFPDIKKDFLNALEKLSSLDELGELIVSYLGRNGIINKLLQSISKLPVEKKKEFGKEINDLKLLINQSIDEKKRKLAKQENKDIYVDVTLPGRKYPKGSLHMLTPTIEEISRIFQKIGFIRVSYPEVEWEYYAFETLNMPKGHPARDDFETFYFDLPEHTKYAKMVLSPHTSS